MERREEERRGREERERDARPSQSALSCLYLVSSSALYPAPLLACFAAANFCTRKVMKEKLPVEVKCDVHCSRSDVVWTFSFILFHFVLVWVLI